MALLAEFCAGFPKLKTSVRALLYDPETPTECRTRLCSGSIDALNVLVTLISDLHSLHGSQNTTLVFVLSMAPLYGDIRFLQSVSTEPLCNAAPPS